MQLVDAPDVDTRLLALQALEAIATDDASTDVDNDHALAICATSVVPRIVRLLAGGRLQTTAEERLQTRAAATTAALVENNQCARMFLGGGCVRPLLGLLGAAAESAHGDEVVRHALHALRMLCIDRDAREVVVSANGKELLAQLARDGPDHARAAAAELAEVLEAKVRVSVDARGHASQARATRIAQSKLWRSSVVSGGASGGGRGGGGRGGGGRGTPPRAHNANTATPGLGASRVLAAAAGAG